MKKLVIGSVIAAIAASVLFVGCTKEQIALIAQQAGIASIATWVGVDNPSDDQKIVAADIVNVVKAKSESVAAGESYYESLSLVLNEYITTKVAANYQPLARLTSGWVLTGIDTFFAMYPKYADDAKTAAVVVSAFCDGAQIGLSMARNHPVIKAATRDAEARAKIRKGSL